MRQRSLLWKQLLVGVVFLPTAISFAQEAVGPMAETERVVVTGSYIPIPTAESEGALPVVNYTREQMINFGSNTPAEALRHLPSFIGTTPNENDSNGGNGSAQVNLRAFGPDNTLTLINGRRAFSFKDINAMPLGAIESVEVLKDGSSAIYGADAVAGVVNFKIRHALNGGEVDLLYGNTNMGSANDAGVKTGYAVGGLTGKRYNITAGASYYEREAIYAADTFLSSLADRRRFGGTNNRSVFFPGSIAANHSVPSDGSIPGAPVGTFMSALNTYVLTDLATTPTSFTDYRRSGPSDGFNFRDLTPSIPAQERYGFFLDGEYQILPNNYLTIFATAIYSHTNQDNGLAPSTFVIRNRGILAASPYNPVATIPEIDPATGMQAIDPLSGRPVFRQRLFSVFYRANENGDRRQTFNSDFYHYIVGLKGEFAKNYFWEVGYVYDEHTQTEIDAGDDRFSIIADAIADGRFNPFVGLRAPRRGTLNGFTYDNPAVLEAASYTATNKLGTRDQSWDGKVGGRAFTALPQGGLNFVVGFDLRHEELLQIPDPILVAGDVLGFQPSVPLDTEQDVSAAFLELNIPIVSSTMKVPGIYNADFTFAWRYEHFDITGTDPLDLTRRAERTFATDVPKFALRYAPYKDLTLRASYSRSFRAPDARSLFTPVLTQVGPVEDPFAPGGPATAIVDVTTGGAVALGPERTDSYSAGFVFTPGQVPNLTITADYYQLNSKDILVSGTLDFVLSQNGANGSFADRIVRDSAGNLLSVVDTPFNAARKSAEGIDLTAVYEIPTEKWGKVTISAAYNHLFRFNAEIVKGVGFTNFLGQFQNGSALVPGSLPRNKGYVQADWAYKGFDFINTLNYIGDYQDFGGGVNQSEPILNEFQQSPDPANLRWTRNRDVREYVTWDMQLSYTYHAPKAPAASGSAKDSTVNTSISYQPHWWQRCVDNTTIRVGMNNIFDSPPPFNAGAFNDNYDTSLYSLRGRYYYVGLNKKF
ncbi:MAG: TonB-dependent receptor [Verrucomicrobiota bacterium]|nr:TonB-dependent receptor [Verrucomicrobiota bacterium]